MADIFNHTPSVDPISYLSKAYGSGDIFLDIGIFVAGYVAVVLTLRVLQALGLGTRTFKEEVKLMEETWELLNEINLEVHELKHALLCEIERARGEVGFVRQELEDYRHARLRLKAPPAKPAAFNPYGSGSNYSLEQLSL